MDPRLFIALVVAIPVLITGVKGFMLIHDLKVAQEAVREYIREKENEES